MYVFYNCFFIKHFFFFCRLNLFECNMLPANNTHSSHITSDATSPTSEIIDRVKMEFKNAKRPDVDFENDRKPGNPCVSDLNFAGTVNELKISGRYFRMFDNGISGEDVRKSKSERGGSNTTVPSIYAFPGERINESSDEEKYEMDWKNIKGIGVNYSSPQKELRRRQLNLEKSILPIINNNSADGYDNDSFKKHCYGIQQCSPMPNSRVSGRPALKILFASFICFLFLAILFYKIYIKS